MKILFLFLLLSFSACSHGELISNNNTDIWYRTRFLDSEKLFYCLPNKDVSTAKPVCFEATMKKDSWF